MSSGYPISHHADPGRALLRPLLLCIDDDEMVLECETLLLQRHGYRTLRASGGLAGIRLFVEHPVDLVIVDHDMPGMDGGEVAQELRRLRVEIPIIMSSGAEISAPVAALVDACIPKGVDFDFLLAAISNLLPFQQRQPTPGQLHLMKNQFDAE